MTSTDVIRKLKADGWQHIRTKGSHHIYGNHPTKKGIVVVPHPKKELPIGTLRSIAKQAGVTLE